jgi:L-lactate dehydrogenase (cytochrome)
MTSAIAAADLAKHNTKQSCWIAIHGKVYDVTNFTAQHPGGASILYKYGGKDATEEFDQLHSRSVLDSMGPETIKGSFASTGAPKKVESVVVNTAPPSDVPPISLMLNVRDFEPLAEKHMSKEGWIYYSTAAEDEETFRENEAVFKRYLFAPRVLVDVSVIDTRTTILGYPCSMPLFITGSALVGLAHPDGEVGLCRAAQKEDIIQMAPCFSTRSMEDIAAAAAPNQILFYQLYVNSDRAITERVVRKAESLGFKALFVTVDAPKLGRREKDMRNKFSGKLSQIHGKDDDMNRNSGIAMALNSYIAANVTWKDIHWLRSITKMKIVLKGVQRADDAVRAVDEGIDGLLLSNHGGRQIDTGRSGFEILIEVAHALRQRGLFHKTELYIDGGIRRGNDIAKCLALGARAVGAGRPFAYGLAAYGQPGAEKVAQLFRAELQNTMGLLGARNVAEITPDMVLERAGNSVVNVRSKM